MNIINYNIWNKYVKIVLVLLFIIYISIINHTYRFFLVLSYWIFSLLVAMIQLYLKILAELFATIFINFLPLLKLTCLLGNRIASWLLKICIIILNYSSPYQLQYASIDAMNLMMVVGIFVCTSFPMIVGRFNSFGKLFHLIDTKVSIRRFPYSY